MGQAKDFTITTFGLLIAYFLPGMVALYGLGFWFHQIAETFKIFRTSNSSLGLFLMVLMGSLTIGLVLTPIRALLYEEIIWRGLKINTNSLSKVRQSGRLESLRTIIDEQYRYHQFWGNLSLAALPLAVGLAKTLWSDAWNRELSVVAVACLLEASTVWAAIESYGRYVERANEVLA
jgi:hypothetical protein